MVEKKVEEKQEEPDKGKGKVIETFILMEINTSKIQRQGIFPQFNISFDKPFNRMSLKKRMIVLVALQAQASQELVQSKS